MTGFFGTNFKCGQIFIIYLGKMFNKCEYSSAYWPDLVLTNIIHLMKAVQINGPAKIRDGQSAPIWSRLQLDPQSFEAPAQALIKKNRA